MPIETDDCKSDLTWCFKDPVNRSAGPNVLIVGYEVGFLPDIAEKTVLIELTQVVSVVEPIGTKNPDIEVKDFASFLKRLECVIEGSSVVPFEVVV